MLVALGEEARHPQRTGRQLVEEGDYAPRIEENDAYAERANIEEGEGSGKQDQQAGNYSDGVVESFPLLKRFRTLPLINRSQRATPLSP
ncbi:MAG: hypothetical protein CYG60_25780 [Actinobacteria bacterium]|nr:MAG: hypothetical protein CYG60_25780 [Actinomycetota bacterium]